MVPLTLAATLPFLNEFVALFVVCVAIAYLSFRLRMVPIVGFLLAGVLIGPHALSLISDSTVVEMLAEIGVILLLFTIGIEFSLQKLAELGRAIFVGGSIQVALTIGVIVALLLPFGVSWQSSVFTGFLVALSSTAIVLGLLSERNETESTGGRLSLAFLIFQDLAIVAMVLLVPMLAGAGTTTLEIAFVLGKAGLLIAAVIVLARRAVPWLLERIAATRRQELFLLTVVTICFGTAAVSSLFGVSLALGAFLAGLVISESRFREQAISEILPLRIVFNAVFFASMGMLLDFRFILEYPHIVLAATGLVVLIKFLTAATGVLALGYPITVAASSGLALAQIGEFSFVLERTGAAVGLTPANLGEAGAQTFIAVTVILMLLTPLLVGAGPRIQKLLSKTGLLPIESGMPEIDESALASLEDHVVIVGYGHAGRRLVRVLRDTAIPFLVIEMNPTSMRDLQEAGIPSLMGDAGRRYLLDHARIQHAKLCVVVISDPDGTTRVVQLARFLNPTIQIIARTRFMAQVEHLEEMGADIVVPEELETTVRIFSQVLGAYMVPPDEIDHLVRALRADDYRILRGSIQEAHLMVLQGLDEDGLHTRAVAVRPGAPVAGKSLEELALRKDFGITVLAVRREGKMSGSPAGNFIIESGDRLVLVGSSDRFAEIAHLFRPPAAVDVT